jgi:hypothetical protein
MTLSSDGDVKAGTVLGRYTYVSPLNQAFITRHCQVLQDARTTDC